MPDNETAENVVEENLAKAIQYLSSCPDHAPYTLMEINEIFMNNCVFDFADKFRATIMEMIEKSLQCMGKGKGIEEPFAARTVALFLIQRQGDKEVVKRFAPLLQQIILDEFAPSEAREECCKSLAFLYFLSGSNVDESIALCRLFEKIFAESYLNDEKRSSDASLHAAALNAWSLLLTMISSKSVVELVENKEVLESYESLAGLLRSENLELRIASAEAIALLFECGLKDDKEVLKDFAKDLEETAKLVPKNSQKSRKKRDRKHLKQERFTFTDVVRYLEDKITPKIVIKLGKDAKKGQIVIDNWSLSHQFNSTSGILWPAGMNFHLLENNFLHSVFRVQ